MKKPKIKVGGVYPDQKGYRVKIVYYDNSSVYEPRFVGIYISNNFGTAGRVNTYNKYGVTDSTNIRHWDLVVAEEEENVLEYETKCRRCGAVYMHRINPLPHLPGQIEETAINRWHRMKEYAEDLLKKPCVQDCPVCLKPTIHDLVAHSPMPTLPEEEEE